MQTHTPTRSRHWRNLLLVALAAALCFGGSFTCTTNTNDDDINYGSSATR
jgi:hypothetical protein